VKRGVFIVLVKNMDIQMTHSLPVWSAEWIRIRKYSPRPWIT